MSLLSLVHTSGLRLELSAEPRADGTVSMTVTTRGHRTRTMRWRRASLDSVIRAIAVCRDECRPPDWEEHSEGEPA